MDNAPDVGVASFRLTTTTSVAATALFVTVGMIHFIKGTRIMIDDYLHGGARKAAIIASVIFGWAVIACALYALARMGLGAIVVV